MVPVTNWWRSEKKGEEGGKTPGVQNKYSTNTIQFSLVLKKKELCQV